MPPKVRLGFDQVELMGYNMGYRSYWDFLMLDDKLLHPEWFGNGNRQLPCDFWPSQKSGLAEWPSAHVAHVASLKNTSHENHPSLHISWFSPMVFWKSLGLSDLSCKKSPAWASTSHGPWVPHWTKTSTASTARQSGKMCGRCKIPWFRSSDQATNWAISICTTKKMVRNYGKIYISMYHRKSMGKLHLYHKNFRTRGRLGSCEYQHLMWPNCLVEPRGYSNSAITWGNARFEAMGFHRYPRVAGPVVNLWLLHQSVQETTLIRYIMISSDLQTWFTEKSSFSIEIWMICNGNWNGFFSCMMIFLPQMMQPPLISSPKQLPSLSVCR